MTRRALLLTFLAGAAGGAALPAAAGSDPPLLAAAPPIDNVPPPVQPQSHRVPLDAQLELVGVTDGKGGEAPVLALRLANQLDGAARATYVFEIRDDRGKLMLRQQRATPFISPTAARHDPRVPDQLPALSQEAGDSIMPGDLLESLDPP